MPGDENHAHRNGDDASVGHRAKRARYAAAAWYVETPRLSSFLSSTPTDACIITVTRANGGKSSVKLTLKASDVDAAKSRT
jgi:hypothetical protein